MLLSAALEDEFIGMNGVQRGVTKHRTGRTGHTVRTGPKYWSFLYEKG